MEKIFFLKKKSKVGKKKGNFGLKNQKKKDKCKLTIYP
jgi:hypothetical protein